MTALGANRVRRDGWNVPDDPRRTFGSHASRAGNPTGSRPLGHCSTARASQSLLATSQHQRRGVWLESKQQAADGLQVSGMDTDVLTDRVDVAKRALDRAGGVERRRAAGEVNEVDCLHRTRNRVPARQPYLRSIRNWRAMSREHVIPQLGGSVEQEEPRRTYEGFGLRQ